MRMNKNKKHFQVTFQINLDANCYRTVDVWASTEAKALSKAKMLLKEDKTVFSLGTADIKEMGCVHSLVV